MYSMFAVHLAFCVELIQWTVESHNSESFCKGKRSRNGRGFKMTQDVMYIVFTFTCKMYILYTSYAIVEPVYGRDKPGCAELGKSILPNVLGVMELS